MSRRFLICLLAAALLLSLCACDLRNRRPSSEFIPQTEPTEATVPPSAEESTQPTETSAPEGVVIREVYVKSGSYTDVYGVVFQFSYRLPYLDATTEFAAGCNSEIEARFRNDINAQTTLMDRGEPLTVLSVDYTTRLRGDVLTLYLTEQTIDEGERSAVYTINVKTGEAVPGTVLLELAGLDEETFLALAAAAIGAKYEQENAALSDELRYNTALDRTLSEENYGIGMPMYLDENDRLVIVATIYDPAGGSHLVPLPLEP